MNWLQGITATTVILFALNATASCELTYLSPYLAEYHNCDYKSEAQTLFAELRRADDTTCRMERPGSSYISSELSYWEEPNGYGGAYSEIARCMVDEYQFSLGHHNVYFRLFDDDPDLDKNNDLCNGGGNGSNPIHSALGYKAQNEQDLLLNDTFPFLRMYSSIQGARTGAFGISWRHNFDMALSFVQTGGNVLEEVGVSRGNGDVLRFVVEGTNITPRDPDIPIRLIAQRNNQGAITG